MTQAQFEALVAIEGWDTDILLEDIIEDEGISYRTQYCENPRCWHESDTRFCSARCEREVYGSYEIEVVA